MHRTLIDCDMLALHLGAPDWRVFDCRFDLGKPELGGAQYWQGHIPGALYAHLDRDLSARVTPTSGRHPLPAPGDARGALRELGNHCQDPGCRL